MTLTAHEMHCSLFCHSNNVYDVRLQLIVAMLFVKQYNKIHPLLACGQVDRRYVLKASQGHKSSSMVRRWAARGCFDVELRQLPEASSLQEYPASTRLAVQMLARIARAIHGLVYRLKAEYETAAQR